MFLKKLSGLIFLFLGLLPLVICQGSYDGFSRIYAELGVNYHSYALIKSEEDKTVKYQDGISALGLNAGLNVLLYREESSPFSLGLVVNGQVERYKSSMPLDVFEKQKLFDLISSSAGINFGFLWDRTTANNSGIDIEGGVIYYSYLNHLVDTQSFYFFAEERLGKYAELQYNIGNVGKVNYYFSIRYEFHHKIESNFNRIFAVDGLSFDLPHDKLMFKTGFVFKLW